MFRAFVVGTLAACLSGSVKGAQQGYWRFEEGTANNAATGFGSIIDSSGNGNNGTPANGPIYSNNLPVTSIPQTGASNKLSMQFNGSNQRVFIPDSSSLALTQSLTLEAYIDPQTTSGAHQIIMRGDDRVALDPYQIAIVNGQLNFVVEDASNDNCTLDAPFTFVNRWSEVAGTLNNATGVMDLYINGTLVASTTTTVRPFATLDPAETPGLGIGNVESSNYNEYFNGLIDEVRISDQALAQVSFWTSPNRRRSLLLALELSACSPAVAAPEMP